MGYINTSYMAFTLVHATCLHAIVVHVLWAAFATAATVPAYDPAVLPDDLKPYVEGAVFRDIGCSLCQRN